MKKLTTCLWLLCGTIGAFAVDQSAIDQLDYRGIDLGPLGVWGRTQYGTDHILVGSVTEGFVGSESGLQKNDVIIAAKVAETDADFRDFTPELTGDVNGGAGPREELGEAIDDALATASREIILKVHRPETFEFYTDGTTKKVNLSGGQVIDLSVILPDMPSLSQSWPFIDNEAATENIAEVTEELCDYIAEKVAMGWHRGGNTNITWGGWGMCALISSGNPKYHNAIRTIAENLMNYYSDENYANWTVPTSNWHISYIGNSLCEYYAATGDQRAIPAIKNVMRVICRTTAIEGVERGKHGHGYRQNHGYAYFHPTDNWNAGLNAVTTTLYSAMTFAHYHLGINLDDAATETARYTDEYYDANHWSYDPEITIGSLRYHMGRSLGWSTVNVNGKSVGSWHTGYVAGSSEWDAGMRSPQHAAGLIFENDEWLNKNYADYPDMDNNGAIDSSNRRDGAFDNLLQRRAASIRFSKIKPGMAFACHAQTYPGPYWAAQVLRWAKTNENDTASVEADITAEDRNDPAVYEMKRIDNGYESFMRYHRWWFTLSRTPKGYYEKYDKKMFFIGGKGNTGGDGYLGLNNNAHTVPTGMLAAYTGNLQIHGNTQRNWYACGDTENYVSIDLFEKENTHVPLDVTIVTSGADATLTYTAPAGKKITSITATNGKTYTLPTAPATSITITEPALTASFDVTIELLDLNEPVNTFACDFETAENFPTDGTAISSDVITDSNGNTWTINNARIFGSNYVSSANNLNLYKNGSFVLDLADKSQGLGILNFNMRSATSTTTFTVTFYLVDGGQETELGSFVTSGTETLSNNLPINLTASELAGKKIKAVVTGTGSHNGGIHFDTFEAKGYDDSVVIATFDLAGNGSVILGETVQYLSVGGTAIEPTISVNDGYIFTGWDQPLTNLTTDTVFTAQYTQPSFTVTFDAGDHGVFTAGDLTQTVTYGASATAPTLAVDSGWATTGWDQSLTNITSDRIITPLYTPDLYTITVKEVNGASIGSYTVNPGEDFSTAIRPPRDGMEITTVTINGTAQNIPTDERFGPYPINLTNVTTNQQIVVTYTGTWRDDSATPEIMNCSFESLENFPTAETTPAMDETITDDEGTVWTFDGSSQIMVNSYVNETNSLLIPADGYVIFTPADLTNGISDLSYSYRGYTSGGAFDIIWEVGTLSTGWTEVARTLNSYNTTKRSVTQAINLTATELTGKSLRVSVAVNSSTRTEGMFIDDIVLYKTDTTPSGTYSVVFDAGSLGTITGGDAFQTVSANGAATAPTVTPLDPAKPFSGWDKAFDSVTQDMMVTAQYANANHTVTYVLGANGELADGTDALTESVYDGESANPPAVNGLVQTDSEGRVLDGYTFAGWDKDLTAITSDLTVQAVYRPVPLPIMVTVNGAGTFESEGETYNATVTTFYTGSDRMLEFTATPASGYQIESITATDGQTILPEFPEGRYTGALSLSGGTDLTVTFSAIAATADHVVVFDPGQGTITSGTATQHVTTGSNAAAPTVTAPNGWQFIGWDRTFTNVQADLLVQAQYAPVTHRVEFVIEQADSAKAVFYDRSQIIQSIVPGEAATAPEIYLTDSAYTFSHWAADFTQVNSDLTVTAVFTAQGGDTAPVITQLPHTYPVNSNSAWSGELQIADDSQVNVTLSVNWLTATRTSGNDFTISGTTPMALGDQTYEVYITATDSASQSTRVPFYLDVTDVNTAPSAADDSAVTQDGEAVTIAVLANDTDPEGTLLAITQVSQPTYGTAVVNAGQITYTPDADYIGNDSFTYTISDGYKEDTATVSMAVFGPRDYTANGTNYTGMNATGAEGAYIWGMDVNPINNVANCDADGNGTKDFHEAGATNVDPVDGFASNTDGTLFRWDYTGSPGRASGLETTNMSYTFEMGLDIKNTGTEGSRGVFGLSLAFTDSDSHGRLQLEIGRDSLTFLNGTAATNVLESAAVTQSNEGYHTWRIAYSHHTSELFIYRDGILLNKDGVGIPASTNLGSPTSTFIGDYSSGLDGDWALDYLVLDTTGAYSVKVNSAPSFSSNPIQGADATEDAVYTATLATEATDADSGDTLTFSKVTGPGWLSIAADGSLSGTATNDEVGLNAFTVRVTDQEGLYDEATLNITVINTNDAPVAVADSASVNEDDSVTIAVLSNDSDIENDALSIVSVTHGSNGNASISGSHVVYTPSANFNGSDAFTYTISDGVDTATATVNVTVNPVNDAPAATVDNASVNEDQSIVISPLSNDSDIDGDALSIQSITTATYGTAVLSGNSVTYTPNANYNGADAFTYTITDGTDTATATVNITVTAVNDAPVATVDTATTDEDTAVTISVLTNDSDVENDTLTVQSVTTPTNGTAVINGNDVVYTPNADYNGADAFTYTVTDGTDTATATVNVTVNAVNDAPVLVNDTASVDEDGSVVITPLSNDSDIEGQELTIQSVSTPANGTAVLNSGSVTYTPTANYNGPDAFTYTVTDGTDTATATVNVTVNSVNDAPAAGDDKAFTDASQAVTIVVLSNDSDLDGDSLTIDSFTQGTQGSVDQVGSDLVYTPIAGFTVSDSFTYTITDGNGGSTAATVTVYDSDITIDFEGSQGFTVQSGMRDLDTTEDIFGTVWHTADTAAIWNRSDIPPSGVQCLMLDSNETCQFQISEVYNGVQSLTFDYASFSSGTDTAFTVWYDLLDGNGWQQAWSTQVTGMVPAWNSKPWPQINVDLNLNGPVILLFQTAGSRGVLIDTVTVTPQP